jgi:hypothetical protein
VSLAAARLETGSGVRTCVRRLTDRLAWRRLPARSRARERHAAEAAARQLGQLTLDNALRLLFLYAEKEPIKFDRAALRWLSRYMSEGKAVLVAQGAARWGA